MTASEGSKLIFLSILHECCFIKIMYWFEFYQ
jgi:hypothetical protein